MGLAEDIAAERFRQQNIRKKMRCPHCHRRLYDMFQGAAVIKGGKHRYQVYGDVIVDCECGKTVDLNIGAA